MSERYVDVNERLVWSRTKLHRKRLVIFILGTIAGILVALIADHPLERWLFAAAAAVFLGFCFYEIYRLMEPNSALIELVPQGIIFRITTENFIVPWQEIRGVASIDIEASLRGPTATFENVTVVLVSRFFYDRVIHVDSLIMRGPGWDAHFVPKGDMVQLALHHDVIPATADEIRRQVEARWKVFGKKPPQPVIPDAR